jgi:hypothetical protein
VSDRDGVNAASRRCSACRPFETARPREPDNVTPSDVTCPRLISVCSLGLVIVSAHRQFDRLLEAITLYAETHDIMWID